MQATAKLNLSALTNPNNVQATKVPAAKAAGHKPLKAVASKAPQPTTKVAGKVVAVTGTAGGAISSQQATAKAAKAKLKDYDKVGGYDSSTKVKVLPVEDGEPGNPHRAGTYRYKAFEALKRCATVTDYARCGHKTKYLSRWAKQGLIRIS